MAQAAKTKKQKKSLKTIVYEGAVSISKKALGLTDTAVLVYTSLVVLVTAFLLRGMIWNEESLVLIAFSVFVAYAWTPVTTMIGTSMAEHADRVQTSLWADITAQKQHIARSKEGLASVRLLEEATTGALLVGLAEQATHLAALHDARVHQLESLTTILATTHAGSDDSSISMLGITPLQVALLRGLPIIDEWEEEVEIEYIDKGGNVTVVDE
jgi:hypothetical protein